MIQLSRAVNLEIFQLKYCILISETDCENKVTVEFFFLKTLNIVG